MIDRSEIEDGMPVVGSDGAPVGTVADVRTGRLILARPSAGSDADLSTPRHIALARVDRVADGRVHLADTAAVALGGFGARVAEALGEPTPDPSLTAPPRGRAPRSLGRYLPYILALVGLLLLFGLYRGCVDTKERDLVVGPGQLERGAVSAIPIVEQVALPDGSRVALEPGTLTFELQRHLAGRDPAGRTLPFDRLNFDTGSAVIRTADRPTIDVLARILRAYPNARVRVVGYADARGPAAANADLGRERAQAVVAALGVAGIAPARAAAVSGGEAAPAATDATPPGQAENRRTELVVTAK
ncbi:OmpA family protein [uncultured Sphingomonas sp.]|uniref:OmpA family protein n=1 Tax=uncultured Sphingomonas sp. TaxID=158754 RepID=UPI0035CC3383